MTQFEVGELAAGGVGGERGDPVAVDGSDPQLGAGMRSFLPDDPHPRRPACEVEQAVQFGDPGGVAGLPSAS